MHSYSQQTQLNKTYTYSTTQNDGRIETMVDAVSGETVQYQYDSLKRLTSAETTGTQWGQSFSYDGFGNMLSTVRTKGSATEFFLYPNPANNRLGGGYQYDANGNLIQTPQSALTMTYDVENRMSSATRSGSGTEYYAYGPSNERVWKREEFTGGGGLNYVYFYGVDGALLATNGIDDDWDYNVYFAGRQVWRESVYGNSTMPPGPVSPDRLGSTVKHFPYGDEPTATPQNREKFATYYRDQITALDYARNRYYSSTIARFTTADPYGGSARADAPQSWNRYTYVGGDPVNFNDPSGTDIYYVGWGVCPLWTGDGYQGNLCEFYSVTGAYMELLPYIDGGGSSTPFVSVLNPSKTGPYQERIRTVMTWIQGHLDAECADWLSGVGDVISGLLGDPSNLDTVAIGHGEFDTRVVAAFSGSNENQTNIPAGFAVTVNDMGAFFVGAYEQDRGSYTLSANGYIGGTSQAQVAILLHELAHTLTAAGSGAEGSGADFGNSDAVAGNDRLVQQHCQGTLDAAANIP